MISHFNYKYPNTYEAYDFAEPAVIIDRDNARCTKCGNYPVEIVAKFKLSSLRTCEIGCQHCGIFCKTFEFHGDEEIHCKKAYLGLREWLNINKELKNKGETNE